MKTFKQFAEANEACWDNYKQIGMKKKNGKQVPNCVPEEVAANSVAGVDMNPTGKTKKMDGRSKYAVTKMLKRAQGA